MRRLILLILAALALTVSVRGEEAEDRLADSLQLEALEEAAGTGLPEETGVLSDYDPMAAIGEILGRSIRSSLLRDALRPAAALLLIALACGALKSAVPTGEGSLDAVTLCGAAAIALVTAGSQSSLTELGFQTVAKLQDFANVLLPTLAAAAAASGQVTAAAAKLTAASLFLNILINGIQQLVIPLLRLYLAAAVAEAAVGQGPVSAALGFFKWLITALLTCLMLGFTLYLSLCAVAGGASDAALLRTAKTMVSTALPVVGSIAADAAGSILASAAVIQKAVGVYGLVAVAALAAGPFLQVGAHYLAFKPAAAVVSGVAEGRLSKLAGRVTEAVGMTLGCLGACALLLYFSIFSMIGVTML